MHITSKGLGDGDTGGIEAGGREAVREDPTRAVERERIAVQIRDSAYHIIEAKGATNFAVGLALVKITTSILRNENSVLTVSTLMSG